MVRRTASRPAAAMQASPSWKSTMSAEAVRAVWQGRLERALDPRARALNDSLAVDARLWPEELALSAAYASALGECGVLAPAEVRALLDACEALEVDLLGGRTRLEGEDVHSAVEAELIERCGEPGRKLHTGRSRNDQVATLLRLHVMRLCDEAIEWVRELERALVARARADRNRMVAAYTHLQPAQPVLLAHLWLAHVAALERDEGRLGAAREASDQLPLGAGAVAGSPLRYDRMAVAARLGFSRVTANSVDAVGDRDFALEYLNAAALLGLHLSRLAEDLVLWCSPGFGWFRVADGFATGSSLLPQKRNPDLFELARAKSGRLLAGAQRLATVLKGLPSAYQKDLQEDKEAVFDAADTLRVLLAALPPAIVALEADPARMAASLTPELLAVELADALVAEGMPFRDAHQRVGRLWAAAERAATTPAELPEAERLALSPHFTAERLASLSHEAAIARRDHPPGAGPGSVATQLAGAEARLGLGAGDGEPDASMPRTIGAVARQQAAVARAETEPEALLNDGTLVRRARLDDVPAIARIMADYVAQAVLLPRPVGELYQCIREFHVAERGGEVVACAALRLLWDDLGEVRSLAVRPDHHGRGLGAALVEAVIADARALALPRVIALTRETGFFERCGFAVVSRDTLPRKVWTDCVRCPRRHACDEVAVVLDLVPGASAAAAASAPSFVLPIPPPAAPSPALLPIVS
jgi:argininosuccinate lyase / amino-acid N-acetyltransferase